MTKSNEMIEINGLRFRPEESKSEFAKIQRKIEDEKRSALAAQIKADLAGGSEGSEGSDGTSEGTEGTSETLEGADTDAKASQPANKSRTASGKQG